MFKTPILIFLLCNYSVNVKKDSSAFYKYHSFTNKAEVLLYEGNFNESLSSYEKAFEYMPPNVTDLVNASIVGAINGSESKTTEWLTQAFSKGLDVNVALKKKKIRQYLGKNKILEIYNQADRSLLDYNLKSTIDSLVTVDQNNRSHKGITDKSIDFQNAECLRKLIIGKGFPSESKIGFYPSLFFLFSHNLVFWLSEENVEIIHNELVNGNLSPDVVALLKDRMKLHETIFKEREYYLPYNFLGNNSRRRKFSVIDIDKFVNPNLIASIDTKREKIGLQNVENSQKINEKRFSKKYQLIISGLL
jgi:tetratricopeptide (TPR) repeat protein